MKEEAAESAGAGANKKGSASIPALVAIIAAIVLCVSFFLPFTTVKNDSIVGNEFAKSFEVVEGSGVTVDEMANPSLVTWARAYKAYGEKLNSTVSSSLNDYSMMFWVIVIAGVNAALALLFALLRKATPTTLFALACLALVSFACFYFESYGPVSSSAASVWAFGRVVTLGAAAVLAAAGIWLFVAKRKDKRVDTASAAA